MTTATAQPATLPAPIQALFDKARAVAKSIAAIAAERDKAELSAKVAAGNFDSQPSRKSLDSLAAARAELDRLAAAVPDDAAAIEAARERIFSDPAAWLALADALAGKAAEFDAAATAARADFAETVKAYVLAGGTVPTLTFENRFGGIEADRSRDRLESLISKRDHIQGQANLCRSIAAGQEPGPGQTFENIARNLEQMP